LRVTAFSISYQFIPLDNRTNAKTARTAK